MPKTDHTWAIVLAAGDGTRLRSLTRDPIGRPVPKQFCSLFGESTLLQDALRRGLAIASRKRLCTVVAAQHAEWWQDPLWALPAANVIVQPDNRGTALGVLLSVLTVKCISALRARSVNSATASAFAALARSPGSGTVSGASR